jgi:hypothetical protein
MKQTAVQWLEERLTLSFGDELKSVRGFFVIAKEMEKMYYTEFEVLQLLLKLRQTESYDSLYDWFQENKKQTFSANEK